MNATLTALDLTANPIGKVGADCLTRLDLSGLRLTAGADTAKNSEVYIIDPERMSGKYSLDLASHWERWILCKLAMRTQRGIGRMGLVKYCGLAHKGLLLLDEIERADAETALPNGGRFDFVYSEIDNPLARALFKLNLANTDERAMALLLRGRCAAFPDNEAWQQASINDVPIKVPRSRMADLDIGHNYIGHNCIGDNYIGDNYIGHNYIGHNYIRP